MRRLAAALLLLSCSGAEPGLRIEQITFGPDYHHFYGYIGHVGNTPWNGSGRYMAALRSSFDDRLPGAGESADIVLIDTRNGYSLEAIDKTQGWNPQQGAMLYWNPEHPDTQLFFNDRDPETGKVFTVLYDAAQRKRVKEFRYEDTPFGNSGVAQNGGWFLGINYARLARLRPVTGYKGAWDWTVDVPHPENDGIFRVNVASGEKELIVSFAQLAGALRETRPDVDETALFINHTLWNRADDRIYFFARGNFSNRRERINAPFTVDPDGGDLTYHPLHVGGHPEWGAGRLLIGSIDRSRQVIYDTELQEVVDTIGSPAIIPNPEGDIALSPDGKLLVNGWGDEQHNRYVIYRPADGFHLTSPPFSRGGQAHGDLRQDPGPCWSPDGTKIYAPAFAADGTRQMFVMHLPRQALEGS